MKALTRFFIVNPKLTIVLSVFLLVFGLMGLKTMNAELFPQVNFAMATIVTSQEGASAEDIETKITKPIEDEIRGVSGIKDVNSISQAGRSFIFVRVDIDNADVDKAMSDLQKAVDRTSLPQDLRDPPKFTELKSEEFPILRVAITGDNTNRLRDIVADQLKEEIEDNKDVFRVDLEGFKHRRFQIRLDVDQLHKYHIGINQVKAKIQSRNVNIPGGDLKDSRTQQLIRLEGKVKNIQDLQSIVIRSNYTGQQIFLKDIAQVQDSQEDVETLARYNGEEATLVIITKKGGADTIQLANDVNSKVKNFQERYGQKVKFIVYRNESIAVQNKLKILTTNALTGFFLVFCFLFIFLPKKIGFAACFSLPLAVLGTLGIMPLFDINLDAISILAVVIALGMLVDNSVVISENYSRLRQDGVPGLDAALSSVSQLALPISATAFTTIAAFLPMLVTTGIMGEFIKFIPIIVTAALLLSLGESFFYLPMRLVYIGNNVKNKMETGFKRDWFHKIIAKFEKIMSVLVNHRYFVALGFIIVIGISLFLMFGANKFILFPAEQTETYLCRFEMSKGTKLEVTYQTLEKVSKEIKKVLGKDVVHLVARAGTSQEWIADDKGQKGNDQGIISIWVSSHYKYNVPHTEVLEKLRKIKPEYVKKINFQAEIHGPPVGDPINATFRSNNQHSLNTVIEGIRDRLATIPGIQDLKINTVIGNDEVFVDIDYAKADRLGLNINNIGNVIKTAISGKIASTITLNNKDVDLMLRLKETHRKNISDLQRIKILNNMGELIPIGKVAKFRVEEGAPQINRFDFKRAKTLTGNVDEKIITSHEANNHLTQIFNEEFAPKYSNVSIIFGGQEMNTQESFTSLKNALVLSLIGIFALLVFVFNSFLRPAIIMTTIPLGLLGFSIAFYLHGRPISFLASIGVIGLGGIIVNAGIVLMSFIERMRKESELHLHVVLVKASGLRLRAVLVTSLTTIGGLLPTAYGIGGVDAMLVPMTLAMAWGLTSGTILTLAWVPCAYAILEDFNNIIRKILSAFSSNRPPEKKTMFSKDKKDKEKFDYPDSNIQ